ncbi:hypothetical protein LEL_07212 [Akanthomyces lecanii RCEF 1005]|uniref:Uncharacterized protein n=1 Tax=Akanthomyces lecanii RCEF 1005 TaxID=1081108 RepID=A0A168FI94_CORDF|nr:hypothetical protein LEL_07212 [Akanthomyces lecanii RCEF 1005]
MNKTIPCQPISPGREEIGLPLEAWDKLNVFMTAAEGNLKAAVAECCFPKVLNIANDCVMWCEVPSKYLEEAKRGKRTPAVNAMGACIRERSNGTIVSATMKPASAAAEGKYGRKTALGLWALLVVGYMTVGN